MKNIEKDNHKILYFLIYIIFFLYFVSKVDFYENYVGGFPDENAHIGYVAYMSMEKQLIPNFENMKNINFIDESEFVFSSNSINYLCHPPLYYVILSFFSEFYMTDDSFYINIQNLRIVNQVIVYIGISIAFFLGFSYFNNLYIHILYASIITNIPMFAYSTAGINNDSLSFTGLTLFLFSSLNLLKNRNSYSSYFLFACSIMIIALNKVTTSVIVLLSIIMYLCNIYKKEKNFNILFNRYFLATIPIYIFVMYYYFIIFYRYETFQPTLLNINYDYYITTGFYTLEENRVVMSSYEYLIYFIKRFIVSWTGIHSHVSLEKQESFLHYNQIGLIFVLFLPILNVNQKNKNDSEILSISIYLATLGMIIIQYVNAYNNFFNVSGYLGGAQARYSVCSIAVIAFCIASILSRRYNYFSHTQTKFLDIKFNLICCIFSLLLFYEDFIYFVLNFTKYI